MDNKTIATLLSSDGYIQVNKELIKSVGLAEAIIVGELCAEYNYWQINNLLEDDMFYSTIDNITLNTGLSEYEQRKAIKHLVELGILTVTKKGIPAKNYFKFNFDLLCNFLSTSPLKIKALDVENLQINNNKQIKINNNSNTKVEDDNKTKEKSKKLSRYDKLVNLVNDYTNDPELKEALISYCRYRLEKNNNFYANMFKGLLNKLDSLEGDKVKIVNNALVNGWNSFYPINDYNNTKKSIKQSACERNVKSIVASEEDIKKEEEIRERRKKNGERICF